MEIQNEFKRRRSAKPSPTLESGGGLLSRAQVAERLCVCPHTIQRLTRRGVLPAIVFNRRLIRYAPETVEAFIQSALIGKGKA